MAVRAGVPLGQDHERAPLLPGSRKELRMHGVVLRDRRADRAGEGQATGIQPEIARYFDRRRTGLNRAALPRHKLRDTGRELPLADASPSQSRSPLERPDHSIRIAGGELALPAVHPMRINTGHDESERVSVAERLGKIEKAPRPAVEPDGAQRKAQLRQPTKA